MSRPPTVLVVDDLPQNARLLEMMLGPQGYLVVSAGSGEEALEAVAAGGVDLVLMDILMPGIDGYEACRRLRAGPEGKAIPVIMVTASGPGQAVAALEAGADDFVAKPFDEAELLSRVRSLLRIKAYHDTIQAQAAELAELNRTLGARVGAQVDELERLGRLRRLVAPAVADLLVASGDESILESHRAEIAVLACELKGFTAFSERAAPEEVIAALRVFHEAFGESAHEHGASVASLSAGGFMAVLNDPIPCDDPAGAAAALAGETRSLLDALASDWDRKGHALAAGAGIALGYATLGLMGFEGRWDYGPVGPVVDLASRLAEAAAPGQILISSRACAAFRGAVPTDPVLGLALRDYPELVDAFQLTRGAGSSGRHGLTPRELEVLALIAEGLSNRAIADRLVISEKTAIRHVSNIFGKLHVRTRAQAARLAVELGLLESSRES